MNTNPISTRPVREIFVLAEPKNGLKAVLVTNSMGFGRPVISFRAAFSECENIALNMAEALSKNSLSRNSIFGLKHDAGAMVVISNPKQKLTSRIWQDLSHTLPPVTEGAIFLPDAGMNGSEFFYKKEILSKDGAHPLSAKEAVAWGVFQGIQLALRFQFGSPLLHGKRVLVYGLGSIGKQVAKHLLMSRAIVMGFDPDKGKLQSACRELPIVSLNADSVFSTACDIFSPCRELEPIDVERASTLNAQIVAGAGNFQIATKEAARVLHNQGILYVPDFLLNAGAHLAAIEVLSQRSEGNSVAAQKICARLYQIFIESELKDKSPHEIVEEMIAPLLISESLQLKPK